MQLKATLTAAELRQTFTSMLPLRIALDDPESEIDTMTRWLDIHEIIEDELLPGVGYRVAVHCSLKWPERAMFDEFDVRCVNVLIRPQLVSTPGGKGLSVTLKIQEIDIKWFPDFVDRAIAKRINAQLHATGVEFRWDFSQTLTFSFTETSKRSNIAELGFDLSTAELVIGPSALELGGPMDVRLDRRPPRELEREPMAALPQPGHPKIES